MHIRRSLVIERLRGEDGAISAMRLPIWPNRGA